MSSDIAIEITDLSKRYEIYDKPRDRLLQMVARGRRQYFHEFWALHDVSFRLRRGESMGIVGRNGSGKSTLLQLICGTLAPTQGAVQTHGRIAALLELGSGFNPEFTGRENVYMNATLLGLSKDQIDARYDDIVAFADIGDFMGQPIKKYSSGMMVRLAFAVIAHVDADILVIDEALAVGDAFFSQKCMRFLRNFMQQGSVLFVSHDTGSVRSLCTRAIWLDGGQLIEDGSPKKISEQYLRAFFEAQQGMGVDEAAEAAETPSSSRPDAFRDQRDQFINHSNLRNDLRIFDFNPDTSSFGKGGARIASVQFRDTDGAPLAWVVGGENVVLRVEVDTLLVLDAPIIGFYITSDLGQSLFGDNTFLSYMDAPVYADSGTRLVAEFKFQMPRLARGNYSVTVAAANGTPQDHVQHHWMHDAIMFRSESTSVASGIVGIPMKKITFGTA